MNCNSRYKTGSVLIGLENSFDSWQRIWNKFFVIEACKDGVKLFKNLFSCFWKYRLSSLDEMNA